MNETTGIGICHLAFILLYFGVAFTAITEQNILDIFYAIFLSIYFFRVYFYKKNKKIVC